MSEGKNHPHGNQAGCGPDLAASLEYRQSMHVLLAQQPNYFGNLPELGVPPVVEIIGNTYFEEVTCVALSPGADVVEATVEVKRSTGYGGDLCSTGSTEWVRFYLSYDEGATWEDVGLSSFTAHDIPDAQDCARRLNKPLTYTVAHPLPNPRRRPCTTPVLPLVRAVLSWQVMPPPGQPDWPPIFGNSLDRHVQLRPRRLLVHDIIDILEVKKIPAVLEPLLPEQLPQPSLPPVTLAEAAKLGHQTDVPPHRFAASLIADVASQRGLSQPRILQIMDELTPVEVDWAKAVLDYYGDTGDTTYEELSCLGLDYNRDLLVATFATKQDSGFGSALCGPGSTEYVAFWVDYDDTCQWSYAGTAQQPVFSLDPLPSGGLHYWVAVPARLAEHYRGCQQPKVARVRAVLSWATPPSTTDPYAMPRWGNAVEAHIEVAPSRPVSDGPEIDLIGGIPVDQIDTSASGLTLPWAKFGLWGSHADPWVPSRQCPFGGTLTVNADVPDSFSDTGKQYRLLWRPAGSSSAGNPVTDPFVTTDGHDVVVHHPDQATGLTQYLEPEKNIYNVLGSWRTRGVVTDGRYEIRLEMADPGGTPIGSTGWFVVCIDNTLPHADLTLTSGTPCNKAAPGDTVTGTFQATDAHFGAYQLDTLPASLTPPAPQHSPQSETDPVPAGTWSLQTTISWAQCGYVVRLRVWDRTVVDSNPFARNSRYDDVGFCLGL